MRLKNFVLAAMAVLAITLPARADILLGFRTLNAPPALPTTPISSGLTMLNTTAIAPGGLTMLPGEVRYVAVTVRVTPTAAGPVQNCWDSVSGTTGDLNQLAVFGMSLTFNPAVADNPYIPLPGSGATLNENNSNMRIQTAGQAYSNALPGDPFSAGWRNIVGTSLGGLQTDGANNVAEIPIAAFKIVATAAGSTNFTLSRMTLGGPPGSGGATQQQVWTITDGATTQSMDAEVFAGGSFNLPVTVVPEPSSMALAGLAFAGMGYRKLRRKKVTA